MENNVRNSRELFDKLKHIVPKGNKQIKKIPVKFEKMKKKNVILFVSPMDFVGDAFFSNEIYIPRF